MAPAGRRCKGAPVATDLLRRATQAKLAAGLGLVGILVAWLDRPHRAGDTGPLLAGTETLARCLRARDLVACEQQPPIGPYPLLQYVPDLAADSLAELSVSGRVRILATLSVVGIAVTIGAGWVTLRRVGCPEWRWGYLLLVAGGPALAYGNTTWGEMPAMGLVTLFVAVALVPASPYVVGLAAFGACLTKETGYPFVAALGLVALLLARRRTNTAIRRHVVFAGIGIALGLSLASAFNVLRYGTPRNAYYLDPGLRTTSLHWVAELSGGLLVSPNGGIVFFWPLASLLAVLLVAIPVARALRHRTTWLDAWPALAVAAIVLALTVGLATWWAPFGWWAWGPRLSLPWVPAIVLVGLSAYGSSLTPLVASVLRRPQTALLVAGLITVAALPHVGVLWHPETIGEFFFTPRSDVCPGGGPPPTEAYYACLREELWERRPIGLDALEGLRTVAGVATAFAVAVTVAGCVALLRRETTGRSASSQ